MARNSSLLCAILFIYTLVTNVNLVLSASKSGTTGFFKSDPIENSGNDLMAETQKARSASTHVDHADQIDPSSHSGSKCLASAEKVGSTTNDLLSINFSNICERRNQLFEENFMKTHYAVKKLFDSNVNNLILSHESWSAIFSYLCWPELLNEYATCTDSEGLEQNRAPILYNSDQCSLMDFLFAARHYHPHVGFSAWSKIRNPFPAHNSRLPRLPLKSSNYDNLARYYFRSHQMIGIAGLSVLAAISMASLLYISMNCSLEKVYNVINLKRHLISLFREPAMPYDDRFVFIECFRVISMLWIFLGHSALYWTAFLPFDIAIEEFQKAIRSMWNLPIFTSLFAVDNFLFISGLLSGYHLYKLIDAQHSRLLASGQKSVKKLRAMILSLSMLITHRYLRLMGTALTILFSYMAFNFSTMPLPTGSRYLQATNIACSDNIVSVIMLVNNFAQGEFVNECFNWTWYLANDFQFFILNLCLIAVAVCGSLNLFCILSAFLILSSTGYSAYIAYTYRLSISITGLNTAWNVSGKYLNGRKYFPLHPIMDYYYVKPWVRVGPNLIGLSVGIFLSRYKILKKKSTSTQESTKADRTLHNSDSTKYLNANAFLNSGSTRFDLKYSRSNHTSNQVKSLSIEARPIRSVSSVGYVPVNANQGKKSNIFLSRSLSLSNKLREQSKVTNYVDITLKLSSSAILDGANDNNTRSRILSKSEESHSYVRVGRYNCMSKKRISHLNINRISGSVQTELREQSGLHILPACSDTPGTSAPVLQKFMSYGFTSVSVKIASFSMRPSLNKFLQTIRMSTFKQACFLAKYKNACTKQLLSDSLVLSFCDNITKKRPEELFSWILGIPAMLIMYAYYMVISPDSRQKAIYDAVFMSVHRSFYAFSLSYWVLLMIFYDDMDTSRHPRLFGFFVKAMRRFMSSPKWLPASRLSYCFYLCHPIVLFAYYGKGYGPAYFDRVRLLSCIFSTCSQAAVAALVSYVLIDSPITQISKVIFTARRR